MGEGDSRQSIAQQNFEADPALVAEGWERRFTGDARRVQEAAVLYTELGYDVLAVPVRADELREECEGCHLLVLLQFKTIYTRKFSS